MLAELALAGGRALGDVMLGDLVAAVKPHHNAVANRRWRHRCKRALYMRTPMPLKPPPKFFQNSKACRYERACWLRKFGLRGLLLGVEVWAVRAFAGCGSLGYEGLSKIGRAELFQPLSRGSLGVREFKGKTVFVWADPNVPLNDKLSITNDMRIRVSLPTIQYLTKAKIVALKEGARRCKVLRAGALFLEGRGGLR
jgi:hypothetical protein